MRRRPSAWWYAVAAVVAVAGVAGAVTVGILGAVGYRDAVDGFPRVAIGRSAVIHLASGGHTIYAETIEPTGDARLGPFEVAVVPVDGGGPVELHRYASDVTYDIAGHHGRAVYAFRVEQAGSYRVTALAPGATGFGSDIEGVAVGSGLGRRIAVAVALAVGIAGLGVVVAVIIIVITAVGRSRSARAAWPPPSWPQPGPPPGWGHPPPPPPPPPG